MKFENVLVIINPAAGKDEPILNTINDVFHEHDVAWDIRLTQQFGDATKHAQEAQAQGYDLVVGYGGDGTQMEVANGVRHSSIPMAILPGGTGNAMAFELNIPRDLRQALELICGDNKLQKVDLAIANDVSFMLRLYSGVEEEHKTNREMKDKYGMLAYPISTLQMVRDLNRARYKIRVDDEEIEEEGITLMVLNAGSIGGINLSISDGIDVTDGLLDVFILDTSLSTAQAATSRFLHLATEQADLHYWRGKEIVIEADPPQTIWVDGELLGSTPVTVTAVPAAISIVVPT